MKLTYFENELCSPLIEEYYELSFSDETLPFKSIILPLGLTNITYIFSEGQKAILNNKKMPLEGLILSGPFYQSYQFSVKNEGISFGMSFHPTALYKILNTDISKLKNLHAPLKSISLKCFNHFNPVFRKYENSKDTIAEIEELLTKTQLTINQNTIQIDAAIDLIRKKGGLLTIEEILNETEVSQKTLETQFKKIVGLTPGRYIRLYRFIKLMRKYEKQQIGIQDLVHMYDYYDRSHFNRDFKQFMHETPKSYFKQDYELVKKVLKK